MTDFADVDITPAGVDGGKGSRGRQTTVFQESEIKQIMDNPGRLTREGIEKKIALWKKSSNTHTVIKYKTMLLRCKNVQKSGKDSKGYTIFSYDAQGNPHWTSFEHGLAPERPVAPEEVVPKKKGD